MKKFLEEFKTFAMRGNVLDLAVGVVIGNAFGAITTSLVNDVIMPIISVLTGGIDFSGWNLTLKRAEVDSGAIVIHFGSFIAAVLDFIIIAFAVFCMVKAINKMHEKLSKPEPKAEEPAPAAPPAPTTEELLAEIRDLLKEQK